MASKAEMELIQESEAEGFSISRLGNLPFVTPFGAALSVEHTASVDQAADELAAGRGDVALALLGRIQRDLGVSQDLHQAAVAAGGEALAGRAREVRRRAALERAAAGREAGEPEPSFGVTNSLELAVAARADLERARGAKDRRGVKEAMARIRRYEGRAARARSYQLDQAWSKAAFAETLALAEARGEEVVAERITVAAKDGRPERLTVTRIRSRDGLATLEASGALDRTQAQAGRAYRLCYEARIASVGVANLEGAHGGLAPHLRRGWERSGAELQRAYLMARLGQMEAAAGAGRTGARRLRALRMVAGEGRCVRELARGGDARERLTAALVEALDTIAGLLGLANQGR